ncbi:MAG: glycosyltransferase [Alistipes sp.]|nr:glycosyltransferase [Alistipes sp.]
MKKLLQINPVVRISTSTGRIMQEIGELAIERGWESYIAYSKGRDGIKPCKSKLVPIGNKWSVRWHGFMTRIFDRHGLASTRATKAFIRQIERIQPDIIHIHNIHGYFLNYKVLFDFLARYGKPVIWTVHDCWLYTGHCYYYSYQRCSKWEQHCHQCPQKRKFPSSYLFDRSSRNFDDKRLAFNALLPDGMHIVPVSDWMRGEMSRSFLKDYPYQVIHNGIDTALFAPCDSVEIRTRYHIPADKKIYLGVASIWSDEKGLAEFKRIATQLTEDEVIVMVGVSEVIKKQLPDNIIAIARTENIKQLAALYSAATAFINPTWQDNYPTVNLEAISCGTPVVTYRTGGSIESITPDTGSIVEQGDVEGLLRAARDIKQRGKSYFTERCRDYALAHFKKEDRYQDYLELYEKLLTE